MFRRWLTILVTMGAIFIVAGDLEAGFGIATPPAVATQVPPTLVSMPGGIIPHNGTLEVDITGSTFPNGLSGFSIRVSTRNGTVAKPVVFTQPNYGLIDVDATSTAGSLRLAVVDVNDIIKPGAVDVVLATVRFHGLNEGVTAIQIDVERMDDQIGAQILTSATAGALTVSGTRDIDGDGITEDVNGNGRFDFADVLEFFRMLVAQPPP